MCQTISMSGGAPEPGDRAADIARAWARERPDLPVASIGILTRIWEVAKLASDDRRRTLFALGLDSATLDLLSTLRRAGPPYRLSTRELTERCLVTAGAITQRVDRAQLSGLVRRLAPERGSRVVLVELTADGYEAVDTAVSALLGHEQQLVDVLNPAQQEQLAGLLVSLLGAFRHLA
jgi:DNA-binding MarR family transcriptional regulator